MNKIYNFSPGPSKLPQSVIDKVEKSINNYKLTDKSVLEISHRSIEFDEILGDIIDFSISKDLQSLQLIKLIFFSFSNSLEEANQLSKTFPQLLQLSLYFIIRLI